MNFDIMYGAYSIKIPGIYLFL